MAGNSIFFMFDFFHSLQHLKMFSLTTPLPNIKNNITNINETQADEPIVAISHWITTRPLATERKITFIPKSSRAFTNLPVH